jgi:hypothetical protein
LYRWSLVVLLLTLGVGCAGAGQATQPTPSADASSDNGEENGDLKPYAEVITDEAESDDGLFTVHRLDEKLYFEIPDSLLDVEMLLVSRIAKTATDIGYGGEKANTQVVRWQRQDDDILLRIVSYENVASEDKPIYEAVRNANFEPIVHAFEVQSLAKDSAGVVIEATDLYTTDIDVLGLQQSRREAYKVKRLDEKRSFLVSAESYPRNIEVRNVLTYDAGEPPSNSSSSTISLEMNHSMVLLPEDPMPPRLADQRVGYFAVEQTDYGRETQKATKRRYITRWRLECDGPRDADGLCTPKKPIVYYIDPATPEQWRPYLKQGVVDWQVAFEAAGFKDAILAKDPPSPEEDPEFSPEDVRYSVIRYFPSETQNAYGPHVHDPRTGEILESDIGWFHNVMNLLRNWYFVQTAASNPKARGVEFDEAVMGELVRFVSAHEVGHTLGLPHNFGSSYAIPVDSLRSPTYTATHGTAPSIMDYARFNYVAQPEDGVTTFTPRVGAYDIWSIKWGYQPVDADTPDEAQATLNAWVKERADDPAYFYGRQTLSQIDPRSQREDLTNDAVEASRLGTANLARIVPNLVEWTYREGENYEELEELYGEVLDQWDLFLGHVVRQVGGVYETHKTYDQDGLVYAVVPEATQREAMVFLNEEAFATPEWLLEEDVLRRIEHAGALERVRDSQVDALNLLLDAQRLARLIEADARLDETYTPTEMLTDLRQGLWSELERGEAIDAFRRNLQRGYLERLHHLMTEEVEAPPAQWRDVFGFTPVDVSQSDIRAYVRGELTALQREVATAIPRTSDRATVLHLRDTLARVDDILNPDD